MGDLEFKIRGMDCAEEVGVLKREVGPLVGGEGHLTFDLLRGKMGVRSSSIAAGDVIRAVNKTGMQAELWIETGKTTAGRDTKTRFWNGRTVATVLSGMMTLAGFLVHATLRGGFGEAFGSEGLGQAHHVPLAARLVYLAGIVAGGWYVAPKALFALRRLRPDMNLLMAIAVIGAATIGEWLEAALVSFLFALSLALEAWSVGRARRAVEALLDLAPPTVRVLADGSETEMAPDEVALGTVFLVKPGERIALDGEVLRGNSEVNQAPITGESIPVLKEPGAQVFAGTINGDGVLEVRTTKITSDTTLAHIIQMVGAAQAKKAPSEQWVEKFARYYTPIVFISATLVFLVPPLLLGRNWQEWIYRALVLLVIGCPCALVISTPVSIVAALAASARNGVLIKGGAYVEAPARLKAIAMDKTGTLTEGRPRVSQVFPEPDVSEHELLELAATMESQSDHPLARAIVEYTQTARNSPTGGFRLQGNPGKGRGRRPSTVLNIGSGPIAIWKNDSRRRLRFTTVWNSLQVPVNRLWLIGDQAARDRHDHSCGRSKGCEPRRFEAVTRRGHRAHRDADWRQQTYRRGHRASDRGGRSVCRIAAGGQGSVNREVGGQISTGCDGRRWRQRRPGDGPSDARAFPWELWAAMQRLRPLTLP